MWYHLLKKEVAHAKKFSEYPYTRPDYTDYTIQFWQKFQQDTHTQAWQDYLAICKVGGTQTFLKLLQTGQLQSFFEAGALDQILVVVDAYLDQVSENDLL